MKIEFKCNGHNIFVNELSELPSYVLYGNGRELVNSDGKIIKIKRYKCPVCESKLWECYTHITQEKYKQEIKLEK